MPLSSSAAFCQFLGEEAHEGADRSPTDHCLSGDPFERLATHSYPPVLLPWPRLGKETQASTTNSKPHHEAGAGVWTSTVVPSACKAQPPARQAIASCYRLASVLRPHSPAEFRVVRLPLQILVKLDHSALTGRHFSNFHLTPALPVRQQIYPHNLV